MILSFPYLTSVRHLASVSATERNISYLELSFEQVDVAGTDDHGHGGVQPARIRHKRHLQHIKHF